MGIIDIYPETEKEKPPRPPTQKIDGQLSDVLYVFPAYIRTAPMRVDGSTDREGLSFDVHSLIIQVQPPSSSSFKATI